MKDLPIKFPKWVLDEVLLKVKLEQVLQRAPYELTAIAQSAAQQLAKIHPEHVPEFVSREIVVGYIALARQLAELLASESAAHHRLLAIDALRTYRRRPGRPLEQKRSALPGRRGAPRQYSDAERIAFVAEALSRKAAMQKAHPRGRITDQMVLEDMLKEVKPRQSAHSRRLEVKRRLAPALSRMRRELRKPPGNQH